MKHLSFLYDDTKNYKVAKKEAKKSKYTAALIQLFSGSTKKKLIKQKLSALKKDFPNATIIGTTTAGEISGAKMYEKESVVSLSLFKSTILQIYRIEDISKKSGKKLSSKITNSETKAAIILSEGLKGSDYIGFVRSIKKTNPHVILAGGLAGDNFNLKKTYIFMDDKIYDSGAVGVSFSGKKLRVNNEYNLNWNPIGKEFTITKVEGNLLFEIDHKNAIEVIKHYLGETLFENNCATLADFPLLYKVGNTVVSRTPLTTDGDKIVLAGPIKEGQKVQFGFSNATSIISGANAISTKLNQNPAEAIYIYSCIARKTLLGKKLESEFASFEQLAPTAGFFTYGEFYSTDTNNALLNCSTTILTLSETEEGESKKLLHKKEESLDSITFNALTHFIEQTSKELEKSVALLQEYKDVVDESSLVSKTDLQGNITYVNDAFCKVSQYSREELIGKNHNIIRDTNISKRIFKKLWHNVENGEIWRGLISNIAKDGSVYYVTATIMPIFDTNHKIKEYIAIRQDVTKQIEAKKHLQEKEKLIKAIFDNQDAIVIYASKDKGMLGVNKKLFEVLNFNSFEEFKAKHSCICDLFLEDEGYINKQKYPNWFEDVANNRLDIQNKVRLLTKDGTKHTFTIFINKIDNQYIINLNDVTQLENAMLKAYASEQAKMTFLANMSHEIRTPLNGILGFADILSKRDLGKEEKRYINIINKSGQTLLNVVNDILDFSKLESGELTLYETDSDLFAEMEATVSTFASLSKSKQVNYYVYTDTTIPKLLKCDAQRLKQVVNNLISNAIKFTPEDGEVHVKILLKSIHNNRAKIHFSVKDSGIGIPKEKQGTVFQAFSQADDSISREFGGTGLGLAISGQYINMMGSQIELKSELGKGSEFFFDVELDVVDESTSITQPQKHNIEIAIMHLDDMIGCAINDIVFSYLDAWNYSYTKVDKIEDISDSTDIIIVCSKIFDVEACRDALDRHEKLQLIYIEGIDGRFTCNHKKFHLVEQPMTGSALFDKIITLTQDTTQLLSPENSSTAESAQFSGHILVAEDNETNQILISLLLQERGIEYTIVDNGQKAIDTALKQNYDLIFMDINMPILDGISATKELRKQGYKGAIVSLSANVIESDLLSYKEAGIDDSLNKPIIPQELDTILAHYLTTPERTPPEPQKLYDRLDLEKISSALKIADTKIIKTLVKSFASSLVEIRKSIKEEGVTGAILHNLKGMVGNLRFSEFQKFVIQAEEEHKEWDESLRAKQTQELLKHIDQLLQQIEGV